MNLQSNTKCPKGDNEKLHVQNIQNWFFINVVFSLLWVSVSSQAAWETIPASLRMQESITKREGTNYRTACIMTDIRWTLAGRKTWAILPKCKSRKSEVPANHSVSYWDLWIPPCWQKKFCASCFPVMSCFMSLFSITLCTNVFLCLPWTLQNIERLSSLYIKTTKKLGLRIRLD